jgi:hypothetical protein
MSLFKSDENTMLLNEARQFNELLDTVPEMVRSEFADIWKNDLGEAIDDRKHLIRSANSVLSYFNSTLRVIGVTYDISTLAIVWLVVRAPLGRKDK